MTQGEKIAYPLHDDIAFKMAMTHDHKLLKSLISSLLGLKEEGIQKLIITNSEITPEQIATKYCRLDLNMVVNGQIVDVEIQLKTDKELIYRFTLYLSKLHANALGSGKDYNTTPQTILICILGENLFDCKEYHSKFCFMETTRHELLHDRLVLEFYELAKLTDSLDSDDMLSLWLRLIKADTEEELEKIERLGVDVMSKAVQTVREMQGDAALHHLALRREMAAHDEAHALNVARREGERQGRAEGERQKALGVARSMLERGYSPDEIGVITVLDADSIRRLQKS
jgi:predicted transposase/invertase (TIGR01784 family)